MNTPTSGVHARVSQRVRQLHPSPVRELISVIQRPGMISFAGGLPAAESLPVLGPVEFPAWCMQYGTAEGDPALRAAIAEEARASGLPCSAEQVVVLSGSQQGIDLVAKLFLDPGTCMAVERPSYVAALQVFQFFGARFCHVDSTRPDLGFGNEAAPVLAYLTPNFRNPTGTCLTTAERAQIAAACDARRITVFEDDPYHALAYQDCDRTPICAQLRSASWIYQGSFSKSLAPGLRLGYLIASPDLVAYLAELKGGADLHSSRLSQWLVLQQLQDPLRPQRLAAVVDHYRQKRDHFAALLDRHFRDLAEWEIPQGGLFFWLTLRRHCDTRALLRTAVARGVAFMPGEPFYAEPPDACGQLRLNFTHASAEQAAQGLAMLATLLREA